MTRWRLGIALVLAFVLVWPLSQPLLTLLAEPRAWLAWTEAGRLLGLARNSLLLVAGTLALCLPFGVLLAVLLYRTNLPLRRLLRFLLLWTLFIPLPLFTSAWQAVLGSGGWLPLAWWNPERAAEPGWGAAWTPWGQGIGSAVWVHTMAGLPWVVLLLGQGLCWVERELEEDALLAAGPWRVLLAVTLRRSGAALAAAALWVALQTATEITVTDLMQVRTFAEEVYTQNVVPEPADGEARAMAVALPVALLLALVVMGLAGRWEHQLPPAAASLRPVLLFDLGRWRWPAALACLAGAAGYLGLPLASLVRRAGLEGTPPHWSLSALGRYLLQAARADAGLLSDSGLVALTAGLLGAGLALVACWAALESRLFRIGLLVLMAVAWALPGPVLGLGMKALIQVLMETTGSRWVANLLYDGPSLAPVLWVDVVRLFPCAVAVLWPVVRLLPRDLRDAARVDGARPGQELLFLVWPLHRTAWLRAVLAVGILALGELGASKLVYLPSKPTFAIALFQQMHYGVTSQLAARCLILMGVVAIGAALVAFLERR